MSSSNIYVYLVSPNKITSNLIFVPETKRCATDQNLGAPTKEPHQLLSQLSGMQSLSTAYQSDDEKARGQWVDAGWRRKSTYVPKHTFRSTINVHMRASYIHIKLINKSQLHNCYGDRRLEVCKVFRKLEAVRALHPLLCSSCN